MQPISLLKLFLFYGENKSVFTFQEVQLLSEEIRILDDCFFFPSSISNEAEFTTQKAKLSSNKGLHIKERKSRSSTQ